MGILSWRFIQLMKFYASAETLSTVHSPFAYQALDYMFHPKVIADGQNEIEIKRSQLIANHTLIERIDFGAGSSVNTGKQMVSKIASSALSNRKKCVELSNLVKYLKPSNMLELGTSLGIMTAYLASANPQINITSFEGDPSLLKIAVRMMQDLGIKNVKFVSGRFDDTLPQYLKAQQKLDFVFLDGHHTYEATMKYYNYLKPHIDQSTVMVIDDIYWSAGMNKAWNELQEYDEVRLTVDRFEYGILFFDPSVKQKNHYKVIDQRYKPWKRVI